MKNLIIIITLLFITTSVLSQAPQEEFQLPINKYFLWDGDQSEEPVHALIGYQDDWKFLVQIAVTRNGEPALFSKKFTAVNKKAFDGEFGAIKLDHENNTSRRSIQLLKVKQPTQNGFSKIVHYLYMSEFNGITDFRMMIKDQHIIDIIDTFTKPESRI